MTKKKPSFETREVYMEDAMTRKIIGAAIHVHRQLGPGLLESTYEVCLAEEFKFRNIAFERQCTLPVIYRGAKVEAAYRIDFLVENQIVLELKSVEEITQIHFAQLLTYLRLLNLKKGLLINFNVSLLIDGVKRISNDKNLTYNSDFKLSASSASSATLR